MRISEKERSRLINTLNEQYSGIEHEVFLFGSRADDNKRGGDIDLLVVVDGENYDVVLDRKYLVKELLREAAGDQRVDLTVATPEKLKTDKFLQSIADSLIRL